MKRASLTRYIFIHCTAGYGDVASIERFWKNELNWNGKGYTVIIGLKGEKWYLTKDKTYSLNPVDCDWSQITNGVLGYNDISISIAYIGGVKKDNYKIAFDSRTPEQKRAIEEVIYEALAWLAFNGKLIDRDLYILGHREASTDKNDNSTIESWERIKDCPSYEAFKEHRWILNTGLPLRKNGKLLKTK